MDMQAVLKAGGVGAAILVLFSLLGLIPCVGCITFFTDVDRLRGYWGFSRILDGAPSDRLRRRGQRSRSRGCGGLGVLAGS